MFAHWDQLGFVDYRQICKIVFDIVMANTNGTRSIQVQKHEKQFFILRISLCVQEQCDCGTFAMPISSYYPENTFKFHPFCFLSLFAFRLIRTERNTHTDKLMPENRNGSCSLFDSLKQIIGIIAKCMLPTDTKRFQIIYAYLCVRCALQYMGKQTCEEIYSTLYAKQTTDVDFHGNPNRSNHFDDALSI